MKSKILGLLAVGLLAGPMAAQAAYIVDTGTPTGTTPYSLYDTAPGFQHLGVTFGVAATSTITSVEAYITGFDTGGSALFELRQGDTPTGTLLFSSLVNIGSNSEQWRVLSGLNWGVAAGSYTLSVIAQPGFNGGMLDGAPTPAASEWFSNDGSGGWRSANLGLGWRIGTDGVAVPEPGTLALLGLGLAGLAAARRRKQ